MGSGFRIDRRYGERVSGEVTVDLIVHSFHNGADQETVVPVPGSYADRADADAAADAFIASNWAS